MKKIILLSFAIIIASVSFAGGKGNKKCCKKDSKEAVKTEQKAEETKK